MDSLFLELPEPIDGDKLLAFSKTLKTWYPHAKHARAAVFPLARLPEFIPFPFPDTHRKDNDACYFMHLPPHAEYSWHTDRLATAVVMGQLSPVYPGQRLEFNLGSEILSFCYKPNRLFLANVDVPHQFVNACDYERILWKISWNRKFDFERTRRFFFPHLKEPLVTRLWQDFRAFSSPRRR